MHRFSKARTVFVGVLLSVGALALGTTTASATGKLGHQFIWTYYATSAHTGQAVGGYTYGYCPSYFTSTWGTHTAYSTYSILDC